MASYRNGRGPAKVDRVQPASSANLRASSSFKSKSSNVRRSGSGVGVRDSDDSVFHDVDRLFGVEYGMMSVKCCSSLNGKEGYVDIGVVLYCCVLATCLGMVKNTCTVDVT
ncbi:hypothetical protein Hanom_Chr04g00286771 [Helianthus anomalus]